MNNQGCVYFFRHVGLSPIKIGCTLESTPEVRLGQMKCFAPYGAEVLGYVNTAKYKELESFLHAYFKKFRLKGEWFHVNESKIKIGLKAFDPELIYTYSTSEIYNDDYYKNEVLKHYIINPKFNRVDLAKTLGISRKTVHKHLKTVSPVTRG